MALSWRKLALSFSLNQSNRCTTPILGGVSELDFLEYFCAMLNFTPLARPIFRRRAAAAACWADVDGMERTQRAVLAWLLRRGAATDYGRRYGFGTFTCYEDFASAVPETGYEAIRPSVMRMVAGERDVLWPGVCRRYAQSSGTSGGNSKYIPITDDSLRINHYGGGASSVAHYLAMYPHSRLFGGKSFILGGSFANELSDVPPGVRVGDLSATLIDRINPLVNLMRVPGKDVALMADWTKKLPLLIENSIHSDITSISGVPSWFMTVLRGVMERAGVSCLHDVWPNLEVFFHGGISFAPYRSQYEQFCDPSRMRYVENYNASEGFFAVQDTPESGRMRLLADIGIFYEFKPVDGGAIVPAWRVEQGRIYSLLISGCNGLWRYEPGDTVRIESVEPLRISIAGRTSCFINAFGEELMVWNADAALAVACRRTGAAVANYTAAPVYADGGHKGHHQWLVEWTRRPSCGNEAFADILDAELQKVNSDYEAKRAGGIFLDRLELTEVPHGAFDRWLASTGKLGGQRKIPRLSNDRKIADAIIRNNL